MDHEPLQEFLSVLLKSHFLGAFKLREKSSVLLHAVSLENKEKTLTSLLVA